MAFEILKEINSQLTLKRNEILKYLKGRYTSIKQKP